jgi:hypothetical protein
MAFHLMMSPMLDTYGLLTGRRSYEYMYCILATHSHSSNSFTRQRQHA